MVRAFAATHHIGGTFSEDRFLCSDGLCLFAVADGSSGGARSAAVALQAVETFIEQSRHGGEYSWPFGIDTELSMHGNRIRTAIQLANRRALECQSGVDRHGSGTTIVTALIVGSHLAVGHVGDSRLYLYAQNSLQAVTHDDAWLATPLGTRHPMLATRGATSVLTNALGVRADTPIHVSEHELQPGTAVLLCSDGLHDVVDETRMCAIMRDTPDRETVAQALVDEARVSGAYDNVTAVVVWHGERDVA